jgi:glutamyl-tRNA reductase
LTVAGAGKMTRLLIIHLASRGLEHIAIFNRSVGRHQELQEQFPDVEIEIKLMDDLWDVVGRSDIVFTATSCDEYVIMEALLELNALATQRPLMCVYTLVPRNVGDDCKKLKMWCRTMLMTSRLPLHSTQPCANEKQSRQKKC